MAKAAVDKLLCLFVTSVALITFQSSDGVYCYTVKVVTKEDNTEKDHAEFFKIVDQQIPPFSLQVDDDSDELPPRTERNDVTLGHGVKVSGIFGNIRHKRSLDKFSHECIHPENVSRLVTVDIDDVIHLPCHSCYEKPHETYSSKQWFKLEMFSSREGLYHIKELVTDTHDDEHSNRVITSLDHTLIIKNAKLTDSSSYICKRTGESDSFLNLRLEWEELSDFILKESKVSFYYHVDVLDFEHTEVVDTSEFSSTQSLKSQNIPKLNVKVITNWYPWSACGVCDEASVRKRFGLCNILKMNKNELVPDKHLEHILNLNADGIPCHSELLGDYRQEMWLSRPNEVQLSECYEVCKNTNKRRTRRGIPLFLSKTKDKKSDKKGILSIDGDESKTEIMKEKVGKYFILKCPDVKIRHTVLWVNGTKLISAKDIIKFNRKGFDLDMFGHIHVKKAALSDSGVYTCWVKGDFKRKYVVTVEEDKSTVIKRYTWYLLYSFLGDFAVFCVLAIIKCLQRSVQRRIQRKPKSESSDDDTESDIREDDAKVDSKANTKEDSSDTSSSSDSD